MSNQAEAAPVHLACYPQETWYCSMRVTPDEAPQYLIGANGQIFCHVVASPGRDAEADARLIRAAPDMASAIAFFLKGKKNGIVMSSEETPNTYDGALMLERALASALGT